MIVADATTLTAFCLIGRSELIPRLVGKVAVSDYAEREIMQLLERFDPGCAGPGGDVAEVVQIDVAAPTLSISEGETLALARQVGARLLVSDDPVVRSEARRDGMNAVGTIGLLYAARARGLIEDVAKPLERLRQVGYAISPRCEQALLQRARE